jgi:Zn finger protein HypA/HybF involved in hydrogenase expression
MQVLHASCSSCGDTVVLMDEDEDCPHCGASNDNITILGAETLPLDDDEGNQ